MGVETVLIGAAIGAGIGAIGGAVSGGGDKIWQGALTGAVGGAITGGVGSWASGAGLGLGNVAGYALGGALGGMGAGALGTALGGGNSSDYLRNIATGGVFGGATGALGGYLAPGAAAGGEATSSALPTDANGIPLTSEGTYAFDDAAQAASGVQTGNTAAPAVQTSVTGATAAPTQAATTTPLAETVSNLNTSATPSTSMSGSGLKIPTGSSYSLDSGFNIPDQTGLQTTGQVGIEVPKSATEYTPITTEGAEAIKDMPAYKSPGSYDVTQPKTETSMWDKFWNTQGTGTGKMGLEDYLKMQGKAQLVGGGIKALGAIATAPETQQNRNQLMDLYNQQNAANQYYQNLMQNTYQNPMGYLGSGEAAATRSAALRQALAQNAAAGRRTQGGALANQLMQTQLQNLQNYRRGIPQPQYGTAAQTLNYAQQYSPTADIFGGLASMATPLSLYSLFPG